MRVMRGYPGGLAREVNPSPQGARFTWGQDRTRAGTSLFVAGCSREVFHRGGRPWSVYSRLSLSEHAASERPWPNRCDGGTFVVWLGTFRNGASLLDMGRKANTTEVPTPGEKKALEQTAGDSVWTYLPILFSAAAICLILFLFLSPNFEAAEPVRARSARPGAETGVTQEKGAPVERQKDRNLHAP